MGTTSFGEFSALGTVLVPLPELPPLDLLTPLRGRQ